MNNAITADLTMPTSATLDTDVRKYFSNLVGDDAKDKAVEFYKKMRNEPTSVLLKYESELAPKGILDFFSYMCDAKRVAKVYAVSKILNERDENF
jgi:deoxyhypusine synthase